MVYYGIISILWNLGNLFHTPKKADYSWGYTILYFIILFSLTVFIHNILIELINKKKVVVILFSITLIIYSIICIEDFRIYPLDTLLFSIAGISTLSLKLIFDLNYKNIKSSILIQKSKI